MTKIRITDIPPGQAPEWVREKWVGLELPIAENVPAKTSQMGVSGGKIENLGGYSIETEVAIEVLKKKSPEAAQWWEENISASLLPWLVFKKEVCKLV